MTREEIIEAIANNKTMPFIQPEQLSEIVDFVIKNYKLSLSSELDEAPKKKLRKVCNLREDLKDEPIEEKLQELREIRVEKDRLDEAAEEYGRKEYSHAIHFWDEGLSKNKPEVMKEDFVDSFKAGAEWMAGQGVTKEAVTGMATKDIEINVSGRVLDELELGPGDKVIVQIRKCDE